MHTQYRPQAGAPIICAGSRKLLGHWTREAPILYPGQRWHFMPRLPVSALAYSAAVEAMDEPIPRFTIWQCFGGIEEAVQVWATDATQPQDLRGSRWFSEVYPDDDHAKIVGDFLKLRVANIIDPRERQYLEGYAKAQEVRR